MDINAFAKEVHANAIEHGWWEGEPDFEEKMAMLHSEWSEALNAYRHNIPMVCKGDEDKPEGIAVELMDGCIRLMDFMAYLDLPFQDKVEALLQNGVMDDATLPQLVTYLHRQTSCIVRYMHNEKKRHYIVHNATYILWNVLSWVKKHGADPIELMQKKHEYNKRRPYRHGGLKC